MLGWIPAVVLAVAALPVGVSAATPTIALDKDPYSREATVTFTDVTDTGTLTVAVSCDAFSHESDPPYAYANPLTVSLDLPGCEGYGSFGVWVALRDGTSTIAQQWQTLTIEPRMTLAMPAPAVTGALFTIDPQWPADYQAPDGSACRWEFRWGDNRSLDLNEPDETFGSLLFDVPTVNGDCAAWTFDLPWVPYRQYEVFVSLLTYEPDGGVVSSANDAHVRFTAAVGGTGRRITTSTLPLAQVLPSTYTPVVGQPVTYTRYLVGGATAGTAVWTAYLGLGDQPTMWHQDGGSTFTITAWKTGNVLVGWDKMSGKYRLGTVYDPPVRYADHYRPNTTAPVQRIGTGALGGSVPVTLTWTGSDRGWGIDHYVLQRSVDGGSWRQVLSTRSRTTSQALAPGHSYRYRVRAIDRYGNVGYWDYGPTFRPRVAGDNWSSVAYRGTWVVAADPTARGGSLHESVTAGAGATFTFTGRDVAWVAERGPTHGRARVYVDGTYVTTVDLAATVDAPARVVFRRHWGYVGTHTVRIVVEGTAGRPTVDVDAFVTLR